MIKTIILLLAIPVVILLIIAFAFREKREYEHVEAVAFGSVEKDAWFNMLMDDPDYRGYYKQLTNVRRKHG